VQVYLLLFHQTQIFINGYQWIRKIIGSSLCFTNKINLYVTPSPGSYSPRSERASNPCLRAPPLLLCVVLWLIVGGGRKRALGHRRIRDRGLTVYFHSIYNIENMNSGKNDAPLTYQRYGISEAQIALNALASVLT